MSYNEGLSWVGGVYKDVLIPERCELIHQILRSLNSTSRFLVAFELEVELFLNYF